MGGRKGRTSTTGRLFSGVQPQWEDEAGEEAPYNYSDPLEDDLQRQIQEEYHSRLYEEWKQRKMKKAAEKIKQTEKRIPSNHPSAPVKPSPVPNPSVSKPK